MVSKWVSSSRCQKRWRVPRLGNAADRALGSPRRPLMAPAGGSGWDGRAAGCGQGEVEEARTRDEKVGGSYRWLAPLLRRRARGATLMSQARHAAGTTPRATRGAGPRGVRPRGTRRPREGARPREGVRGPGSRGWQAARAAACAGWRARGVG
jgi:hypothetical protein